MSKEKVFSIEERIPRLQELRKKKANRRLVMYISLFFLLISLIIYIKSPLSDVQKVEIKGNFYLTEEEIKVASSLHKKVNFWEIHTEDIVSSLKLLPEIKQVSARKHWYNSITIETTEYLRIGYLLKANKYYPVLEDGTILSQLKENTWPTNAPLLFNWEQGENLTKLASEMKNLKPAIVNSISEIHYSPSQLDSWRVVLFMNEGYKVIANLTNFSENLSYYPSILAELKKENYPDGIIHLEVGSYFEYLKE